MTKKEYRRMCEMMDNLLMPLVGHLKEEEKNQVESALRILRENQGCIPISVIADIQSEIDEQWYIVKRESIECAEGLEMASEIIRKHTSGKEGE